MGRCRVTARVDKVCVLLVRHEPMLVRIPVRAADSSVRGSCYLERKQANSADRWCRGSVCAAPGGATKRAGAVAVLAGSGRENARCGGQAPQHVHRLPLGLVICAWVAYCHADEIDSRRPFGVASQNLSGECWAIDSSIRLPGDEKVIWLQLGEL